MIRHCPYQSSFRDDVVIAASTMITNFMPFRRPHFLSLFEKLTSSAAYSFSSKPLTSSHASRMQNRKAPPASPSFGDAQFHITDITLTAQPTLPSNFNNAPPPHTCLDSSFWMASFSTSELRQLSASKKINHSP